MDNRLIDLAKLMCSTDWEDDSRVESEDFILSQFQGTAFQSSYKCAKVITKGEPLITEDEKFPKTFVAKISNGKERQTLLEMHKRGISVPAVYGAVKSGDITVIFEELVEGKELYMDTDTSHWTAVADILAKVHQIIPPFKSLKTYERINEAWKSCKYDFELKTALAKALARLKSQHHVLVHGDMFPTNVLIEDDGTVTLIDWADSGYAYYVNDLGRLTGMIDYNTLQPFCPCEEGVCEAYYNAIKHKIDYEDYIQDFYAGQFIETAAYYDPSMLHTQNANKNDVNYSIAIRNRLIEIASKMK